MEYIQQAFDDARQGRGSAKPYCDGVIASTLDPTIAPEGMHIFSMFAQWVPQEWHAEPHREEVEAFADRLIDGYNELAPNLKSSIVHRQVISPYDMEHEYGLIGGNIFHGELTLNQLFHMRPAAGYANYRTPIKGLYQCGSSTHPGRRSHRPARAQCRARDPQGSAQAEDRLRSGGPGRPSFGHHARIGALDSARRFARR